MFSTKHSWLRLVFCGLLFSLSAGKLLGDNYFDFDSVPPNGYYNGSANITITTFTNAGEISAFTAISNQNLYSNNPIADSSIGNIIYTGNTTLAQYGWNRIQGEVADPYNVGTMTYYQNVFTPARYFYVGNLTYKVNFQASGAPPTGYVADTGNLYPSSPGTTPYTAPSYGWLTPNISTVGDPSVSSTWANMTTNATWQIQLPPTPARYWVTVGTIGTHHAGEYYTLSVGGHILSLNAHGIVYDNEGVEVEVSSGNLTVQNLSPFTADLSDIEIYHLGSANGNGRYLRGTGFDPGFQSFVTTLDGLNGTEVANVASAYPAPTTQPWFVTVPYRDPANITNTSPTVPYHLAMTNGNITANGTVTNGSASNGVTIDGALQSGLLSCAQPIVAFGNTTYGGTKLYAGTTYNFGVNSGWLIDADNLSAIAVVAYNKTQFNAGNISPQLTLIKIPGADNTTITYVPGNTTTLPNFIGQGFSNTTNANELETTVRYLPSLSNGYLTNSWDVDTEYALWSDTGNTGNIGLTKAHFPLLVTHRATGSDYYYEVYGIGRTGFRASSGGNMTYTTVPMAGPSGSANTSSGAPLRYEPIYTLEFSPQPSFQANVLTLPDFAGVARPPDYGGQSAAGQAAMGALAAHGSTFYYNSTTSGNLEYLRPSVPYAVSGDGNWTAIGDASFALSSNSTWTAKWTDLMGNPESRAPEFDQSSILDNFVAQMGNDPMALAAYVQNEIQLTNMLNMPVSGSGATYSSNLFYQAGMDRGALGTFLEGRGSPVEQCALLIYLLRQAGYNAVYVFPNNNQLLLTVPQLDGMLGLRLEGDMSGAVQQIIPNTTADNNAMLPVTYPWVAVQIGTQWINLFPWLKDVQMTQGPDLWGSLPLNYENPLVWLDQYLHRDNLYSTSMGYTDIFNLVGNDGNELPSVLFPRWVNSVLNGEGAGFDISQVGIHRLQRTHAYSSWADFPVPAGVPTSIPDTQIFHDLSPSVYNLYSYSQSRSFYNQIEIQMGTTDGNGNFTAVTGNNTTLLLEAPRAHNRRIYLSWSDATFANASLIAAPYGSLAQVETSPIAFSSGNLALQMSYTRNQKAWNYAGWGPDAYIPNEFSVDNGGQIIRNIKQGDLAAICVQYDTVSDAMLAVHADDFWNLQSQIAANDGTGNMSFSEQDKLLSALAALNGYQYFHNVSSFAEQVTAWNSMAPLNYFSMGLSKIGILGNISANNTARTVPGVDMEYAELTNYVNPSTDQATGEVGGEQYRNYYAIWGLEASAQEGIAPQAFYSQANSISTVELLELSEKARSLSGQDIDVITSNNLAPASSNYTHSVHVDPTGNVSYSLDFVNGTAVTGSGNVVERMGPSWTNYFTNTLSQDPETIGYITPTLVANGNNTTNTSFEGAGLFYVSNYGTGAFIDPWHGGYNEPNSWLTTFFKALSVLLQGNSGPQGTAGYGASGTAGSGTVSADTTTASKAADVASVASGAPIDSATSLALNANAPLNGSGGNATLNATILESFESVGYVDNQTKFNGSLLDITADPVNTATGELNVDETDIVLPGPLPLEIRRNYGSLSAASSANNLLGFGWKLSLMPYLQANPGGSLYAAMRDGSVIGFTENSGNTSEWDVNATINPYLNNSNYGAIGSVNNYFNAKIYRSGSAWNGTTGYNYTLNLPDGSFADYVEMQFPLTSGNTIITQDRPYLTEWQDAKGNFLTFTYYTTASSNTTIHPEYGQLQKIQSSNGNFLVFSYDSYGHVTDVLARDGRTVHYGYNNSTGDLISVTRPDGSQVNYSYYLPASTEINNNIYHLLTEIDEPEGRRVVTNYLTSNTSDPHFRWVANQWTLAGSSGNLVQTANFTYTQSGNILTSNVTDALGNTTIYRYYQPLNGNGTATNSLLGQITDPLGRNITNTWYVSSNSTSGCVTIYNGGNGTVSTVAASSVTYYPGSLKSMVDQRGLETDYTYDSNGNVLTKAITGNLVSNTTSGNATWSYSYNGTTNLVTQELGPSINTFTTYGNTTASEYLPIQITTNATGTNATVSVQSFTYGTAGNTSFTPNITIGNVSAEPAPVAYGLLCSTYTGNNSSGEVTAYQYNGNGYPIQKVRFDAVQSAPTATVAANAAANITANSSVDLICSYVNDLRGYVVQETDPGNVTKNFDYDAMGRQTEAQVYQGSNLLSDTRTYYDGNGLVTWIDGPRYGAAEDYIYRSYNPLGQLSSEIRWRTQALPDGSGVEQVPGAGDLLNQTMTTYGYDEDGNLLNETDSNGNYKEYTYDADCERQTAKSYDASGTLLSNITYTYEPGGKVASMVDPLGGNTTYYYTSTGQLSYQQNPDNSIYQWSFNTDGRPHVETLPNGQTWTTTYDDGNCTTTRAFSGNEAGAYGNATEVTVRDPRGNVIEHQDVDGFWSNTTYDGLDRVSNVTGPAGGTGTTQQIASYAYDLGNLTTNITNAGNETSSTISDALGRPVTVELISNGTVVRRTDTVYDPTNWFMTVTEGNGSSNPLVRRIYSDEAGHTILTQYLSGNTVEAFTLQNYDPNGNLLLSQDEAGRQTTYTYDGLNRVKTTTRPDGGAEMLSYDGLGHLTSRAMPGNLTWSGNYNSASQLTSEQLANGGNTTRAVTYTYNGNGTAVGLLASANETSHGVLTTYGNYSPFNRPTSITFNGYSLTENIASFTRNISYDNRGHATDLSDSYTNSTAYPSSEVIRSYDGYGQLLGDEVKVGGNVVSNLTQDWSGAGRRSELLNGSGNVFGYTYDAAGHVTGVADQVSGLTGNSANYTYAYETNGVLTSRTSQWRTVSANTTTLDYRGRPTELTSAGGAGYGGGAPTYLTENLTWNPDGKLATYSLTRNLTSNLTGNIAGGATIGSEARAYTYDAAGRLLDETFGTTSGNSSGNIAYGFDANKLGVRVSASTSGSPSSLAGNWTIPTSGLNGFAQATLEQQDPRFLTANGTVNGPVLWMSASVDGTALPGLAYYTANATTGQVNWSAPMTAGLGNHSLVVSAGHPSGAFTATGTSNFTVATAQNVTNTHDGGGFVTQRSWSAGPTDNLTWDAAGRLLKVSRRDSLNDGFDEQSIYDPLGRRVRTVYTPYSNSTADTTYATSSWNTPATPGQSETTDSWYDPSVEFLEVATVQTSGNVSSGVQWKIYGPDESGQFGGVQGVGGLEAVIDTGGHKVSAVWSDFLGHVEAYSVPATISGGSATPGLVTPQSRSSGYGLLPGEAAVNRWSQSGATGTTANLAASLAWQGRRMDASGYYSIGAREYNPTAGRFLSPDPLGQAKSWDLYSYAGGDPINYCDPTGCSLIKAQELQQLQPPDPSAVNNPPNNAITGGSALGNLLQQIPLIGPILGRAGDIVSGAITTAAGVVTLNPNMVGNGVSQIAGGVGGLAQIGATDAVGGVIGAASKIYTVGLAATNLVNHNLDNDSQKNLGHDLLVLANQIVPSYAMFGGPLWGTDQNRPGSKALNFEDYNNYVHDVNFGEKSIPGASMQWVQNNWSSVPNTQIGSGPLGIAYVLLGTFPFAAIDGFHGPAK